MRIAPIADVKARFSQYLQQSEEGPVIVTKNGRPVAVLISVTDEAEMERLVLAHTPRFRCLRETAEQAHKANGWGRSQRVLGGCASLNQEIGLGAILTVTRRSQLFEINCRST